MFLKLLLLANMAEIHRFSRNKRYTVHKTKTISSQSFSGLCNTTFPVNVQASDRPFPPNIPTSASDLHWIVYFRWFWLGCFLSFLRTLAVDLHSVTREMFSLHPTNPIKQVPNFETQ
jgi:hypothetical protein